MRFLYDNKFMDGVITSTTENPNYPLANLQDTILAKYFRTTSDSSQWIKLDLASTLAKYIVILSHNFSSGATIVLEGNDTDSWGAPSLSQAITWTTGSIVATVATTTYNYYRLTVDDGSNPDNYLQIGSIYIGSYIEPAGMSASTDIGETITSKSTISHSGQAYGDKRVKVKTPVCNFTDVSSADYTLLKAMTDDIENLEPVICIFWYNEQVNYPFVYGKIDQQILNYSADATKIIPYSINLKIKEIF